MFDPDGQRALVTGAYLTGNVITIDGGHSVGEP